MVRPRLRLKWTLAGVHPLLITFLPKSDLQSVFILSTTAISTRNFPIGVSESAKLHGVKLVGAPALGSSSAVSFPTSSSVLTVECADTQLKREAREAKLDAVYVLMRGNKTKIDAFVGPQRDLGSETVISAICNGLSVQQALLRPFG